MKSIYVYSPVLCLDYSAGVVAIGTGRLSRIFQVGFLLFKKVLTDQTFLLFLFRGR